MKWCRYKQTVAANKQVDFQHTNSLPKAVMDEIKPVFRDLTHPDLLRKCLDGYTQNSNESVNSVIWKHCPKHKNHGVTVVKIGLAIAVCSFNDGAMALKSIMTNMELTVGKFALDFFTAKDIARIKNAQRGAKKGSLEARRAKRRRRLAADEQQREQEGQPYLAGGY